MLLEQTEERAGAAGGSKKSRAARPAMAILLALTLSPCLRAADYNQWALNRADTFLRGPQRGHDILSYVHFGASYHGHRYLKTLPVRDSDSDFALVYRFDWEDDGVTDVAFLCDRSGSVYGLQIMYTNAVLSRPFALANASISLIGHGLISYYKDRLSENDRRQLLKLVDEADSKGLLEWSLRIQQLTE